MCRVCLQKNCFKMEVERFVRKVFGVCLRCGKNPPKQGVQQCQDCTDYLTKSAKKQRQKTFFGLRCRSEGFVYSVGAAKMLWSLWKEQRGRCALTGRRLNRNNSQVDHIVPKSKGGSNERTNLRWLHTDVNQARRALSDSEFLDLCRDVAKYAKLKEQNG